MILSRTIDYWIVLGFLTFLSCAVIVIISKQVIIKSEILTNRAEYIKRSADRWSRTDHERWCHEAQDKNPGWNCPEV